MNARDRLLTGEEMAKVYFESEVTPLLPSQAIAVAQDAKTLRALRGIIEWAVTQKCLKPWPTHLPCGHCATCQARQVLAEMNAQAKGKEAAAEEALDGLRANMKEFKRSLRFLGVEMLLLALALALAAAIVLLGRL